MASKKKASKSESIKKQQQLHRQLLKLWERGQSKFCEVRDSGIHGRGVYATRHISKEERIIEYIGEIVDKDESDKRGTRQHEHSLETGDAAVYIFTVNKKYDLDGNVPWNTARLINHSCDPNCEAWIEGSRIFIHAMRDIEEGEELSFDYGFDIDCFEDHPCRCGKPQCIGYIVSREQWPQLEERLKGSKKG